MTPLYPAGWFYLKAGDGVLFCMRERVVDPGHNRVICHLLSVTEVLEDVQSVPEDPTNTQQEGG